ncbi:MAG: hypothetical protein K2L11_05020 [Muribaculaceae bacterium]|nr:hypothetical protein [Muribaculaceae bacterium]
MKQTALSSFALLLLGFAIWWMCANAVWLGDDLDYKYMMKGELWQSWGYIHNIGDFFRSQLIHYQHVNGRFVAHSLVQLFNAFLGQQIFAICNAVIYMLLAILLARAGEVKVFENPQGLLSAICLAVLCFITKMMPTCQIGYIWAMTANIAWLMIFFRTGRPSWTMTAGMFLIAIIVGNWQESVSLGVCGGLGAWWILQLMASRRNHSVSFDWRRSWILLGYVAGTATNCLAPSTMGRVSEILMPLSDRLLIASYSFPAVILLIFCFIHITKRNGAPLLFSFKHDENGIPSGMLTVAMLFLLLFNLVIGVYSNRQLFGANLFASILVLRIMPLHRFCIPLNVLAAIGVIAFWVLMIIGITEVRRQYDEIVRLHSESDDGNVSYARTRIMTLGFPLRAKYYEDILGQFDNDLHHSLMKDFKHVRRGKTLKLKPNVMIRGESIERYAPGHFTVTLKEPPKGEAPREVIAYGHYPIFGIMARPRVIQVTRYSQRSKTYGTAVIIPEFPFFIADSIAIVPYSLGCGTNQPIATP